MLYEGVSVRVFESCFENECVGDKDPVCVSLAEASSETDKVAVSDLLTLASCEKDVEAEIERDLDCSWEGVPLDSLEGLLVTSLLFDLESDMVTVGVLVALGSFDMVVVREADPSRDGEVVQEGSPLSVIDGLSDMDRLLTDANS